jgi:hypothetical protein
MTHRRALFASIRCRLLASVSNALDAIEVGCGVAPRVPLVFWEAAEVRPLEFLRFQVSPRRRSPRTTPSRREPEPATRRGKTKDSQGANLTGRP